MIRLHLALATLIRAGLAMRWLASSGDPAEFHQRAAEVRYALTTARAARAGPG